MNALDAQASIKKKARRWWGFWRRRGARRSPRPGLRDDAGLHGNRLSRQALRISLAVPLLVVRQGDHAGHFQQRVFEDSPPMTLRTAEHPGVLAFVAEDFGPDDAMLLHDLPFVGR